MWKLMYEGRGLKLKREMGEKLEKWSSPFLSKMDMSDFMVNRLNNANLFSAIQLLD